VLEFIAELKSRPKAECTLEGKRIAVLGGGNTAIDGVTQSTRLGAEKVYLVYRRGPEQMGAYDHEVELAKLDGVEFVYWAQPVEIVGQGVAANGDGVTDELLIGEMSALHIFATNMERPVRDGVSPQILQGFQLFNSVGCARCHVPTLATDRRELTYSFPQDDENPFDNVYYESDLHDSPAGFDLTLNGGLVVPQFSDLKRHYMGPGLEETFGHELDGEFITARLWGVADTAPYLHDGRALTLTDAILAHGGEAEDARNDFDALGNLQKQRVLTFLRSLRTPTNPGQDIIQ